MSRIATSLLLALLLLVFAPAAAWSDAAPFEVTVSVNADSLKTDFYKTTGTFFMDTTVKNVSGSDQKITFWTQRGWSWLSSSPVYSPGIEAAKNYPTEKTLHPGEEYKSGVEMHTVMPGIKQPAPFRLGFYPNADRPVSGITDKDMTHDVYWSNTVTLGQ